MFDFVFRKKITILLLLGIVVISLIFSILLKQPIHEGLENDIPIDATINNPPPDIIDKAIVILKDKEREPIPKLSEIRALLKNKYKILGDIYRQNESAILKELNAALSVPAKKDRDGKLYDENALDGEKRDKANKILSSNDYSAMEKIEKISELAGKDKIITTILNEYGQAWLRMVRENIEKLKANSNDLLNATPSS